MIECVMCIHAVRYRDRWVCTKFGGSCPFARHESGQCGPDAKHFERA